MVHKGCRGHTVKDPRRFFLSDQKRSVFGTIVRELRRRPAIEPIIGHVKTNGQLDLCNLRGGAGDAANVVLTAVGYNLRLVLFSSGEALLDDLNRLGSADDVAANSERVCQRIF